MKHRLLLALMTLALLATMTPLSAEAVTVNAKPYNADELIVALEPGYKLSENGRMFNPRGVELPGGLLAALRSSEPLSSDGTYQLIHLREGSEIEPLLAQLAGAEGVRYAEPNYVRTLLRNPNDPFYNQQWGQQKISAPQGWDITTGNPSVVIAILDTGVSPTHEELRDRLLPGYNALNNTSNSADNEGHGTFTAGVAAAAGDNGVGVAGMCWNCKILPVKVLDSQGRGSTATIVRGMRWAADQNVRIMSMSLGSEFRSRTEEDAVNYAYNKGVLIIAASGNSGSEGNPVIYPAAYDHVLAVGASTPNDTRASFSSYGSFVDVAAPGVGIWSSVWHDGRDTYAAANGTSAACPYVSGLAGLALSLWPELSADQLSALIVGTTDDIQNPGRDDDTGTGRINAQRTLEHARDRRMPGQGGGGGGGGGGGNNPAFAPVQNPNDATIIYFPETQHTLRGEFRSYWEKNGGLAVFGYPISEEFFEDTPDGRFLVQYFERERFEFHPEKQAPYHVLLGRLGDTILLEQGRNWFTFPKGQPQEFCRYFEATGHTLCGEFLQFWMTHGLDMGDPGVSERESLALFGMPISEPMWETNQSGDTVLTQWFERASFEFHGNNPDPYRVMLGLLGTDLADRRDWR